MIKNRFLITLFTFTVRDYKYTQRSTCKPSPPTELNVEFAELKGTWPKNLDRMSRAIFSAETALVSMVLAAFSKAFT